MKGCELNMKSNLFLAALATAVAIPAVVAPIQTEAATKTFTDVPKSYVYYDVIMDMTSKSLINGYPDGTFKPNQSISRQHAAVLVDKAMNYKGLKLPTNNVQYKPLDLPTTHIYYSQMKALLNAGILSEDGVGKVYPQKNLPRGAMAKILSIAFNLKATKENPFTDTDGQYDQYISALYSNGLTTGYPDGTFKPNETLNRAHYSVFLNRAMNLAKDSETPPVTGNALTYSQFMNTVKTNPLFSKEFATTASFYKEPYHNVVLNKGQDLIKGTNWNYINGMGEIRLSYTGYVNKLDPAYPLLSIVGYDKELSIAWDFRDSLASQKAAEFLNLLVPGLGLESEILAKSSEALQKEANGERFIGNREKHIIGDYEVWVGVFASFEYGGIDIKYIGD